MVANPRAKGFLPETWQLVRSVWKAMAISGRNLFRKPVTVHYPDKPRG